jgi:Response regulator containing a CheY-like receiver domain and an HD-GYP domain
MKKVLLTSASQSFLDRNTKLLMKRGFRLITAKSGEEALRLNKESQLDLILSDVQMVDMSGCTLCHLIQSDEDVRHVPVIVSCHDARESIDKVMRSGASGFILKPIDPIQLMEAIGGFVGLQLGRSKRVVLKVKVLSKELNLEFLCLSHDISNSGILLETGHQLLLSSRIICQFTLPGSCRIETEGKVVRKMSALECNNLYGVKFIALRFTYRRAIDEYIASIPD